MKVSDKMTNKEIIKKVNKERQTVKSYSDKKISKEDFELIKETIQWAPSSLGFEPYRVLIFEKGTKHRKAFTPIFYKQGVIEEADKLLIFVSLKKKEYASKKRIHKMLLRMATEVKGLDSEKAEKEISSTVTKLRLFLKLPIVKQWSTRQAYIPLGMAMFAASMLNIGSTPTEGFSRGKLNKYLRENNMISSKEKADVTLALGYPKSKTAYLHWGSGKRVRLPMDEKFATY